MSDNKVLSMLEEAKEAAVADCNFDLASDIRDVIDKHRPRKFSDPVFIGEHTTIHDEEMPPKDQRKQANIFYGPGNINGLLAEHYEFWEEPGLPVRHMVKLWNLTAPIHQIADFINQHSDIEAEKPIVTLENMDEIRRMAHLQLVSIAETVETNAVGIVTSVVAMFVRVEGAGSE